MMTIMTTTATNLNSSGMPRAALQPPLVFFSALGPISSVLSFEVILAEKVAILISSVVLSDQDSGVRGLAFWPYLDLSGGSHSGTCSRKCRTMV